MNSDERRQKIIDAAITVLLDKGVAASRMNDFVEASGLSKGGVYHHFDSKEDLLIGVLEYFMQEFIVIIQLEEPPVSSAYQQLEQLLHAHESMMLDLGRYTQLFIDFLSQSPYLPRFQQMIRNHYELFHSQLVEIIQRGIQRQEFLPTTNPEAIAAGLMGVFDGVGIALTITQNKIEFPHYAVESAMAMLRGILNDEFR
ncbi:TetR/AcrR family transcriptional regulator [Litorivivens sp.]|uniref:TetR/AcrR family transcriptional regulator n=1 Tax=Litorivivens sp. TaxID=2020868 RepID=UPI003563FB6F